jgi:serine/threonine protein kinase
MIGQQILHYKILEKLGEGGMGVVYLAEDTRLKRQVAIKFLPRQIAANTEERQRFEIEAQAAAGLNHPNIATIYAIEEANDDIFIVMEYIEGLELRDVIANAGVVRAKHSQQRISSEQKDDARNASPQRPQEARLSINEIINIAAQIAEGLQAAHEKGIIHRDIKSSNIMLTEKGQVKIMDFGLAKIAGSGAQLTKDHSTLGTAAYMSPEQARGEEVDQRSDIWSFGVVLYEMLTGKLPFGGEYEQAVMYSILNEAPAAIAEIREDIPAELEQLVQKTLEKEPDHRYQSMNDLLQGLKQSPTDIIAIPKPEKSIVVLPFENISPDPENEYFSDGLTEEIIADLSMIEALRVISRTSAMRLKGTDKDIKTIGRELEVQFVLEGSVRKAGNNLRITAQLIDTATDAHLWAEKYRGTLDDVFQIQENVSRALVEALKLKLAPEEAEKLAEHPIADARAYDYYFRARQETAKGTAESLQNALELIQNGLDIVGENTLLLAARGYVHWMYFNAAVESDEKHLIEAERLAQKIFELEPESVHGYRLLGMVEMFRGNMSEALEKLDRVLQLDPNDPDSLAVLTVLYSYQGRSVEAKPFAQKLRKIDPLAPFSQVCALAPLYVEGHFDEYARGVKVPYDAEPDIPVYRFVYFHGLAMTGKYDEALTILDKPETEIPDDFFSQFSYFFKHALLNEKEKALRLATDEFKATASKDLEYSSFLAQGFALLNERAEALHWLENAANLGFINYPFLTKHDPFLENLRGDKRFEKLMAEVKREWEKATGLK